MSIETNLNNPSSLQRRFMMIILQMRIMAGNILHSDLMESCMCQLELHAIFVRAEMRCMPVSRVWILMGSNREVYATWSKKYCWVYMASNYWRNVVY